jgi:hypothetical protein
MSERDYTKFLLQLENDVRHSLHEQEKQNSSASAAKVAKDPSTDISILFALPRNCWMRQNFQKSAQTAVQMEQRYQRQQLRQQQKHFRGTEKPAWNDETIAAAYIPIAMQAQTLAYERAVLNAMETNDRVTISNPDDVNM